MYLLRYSSLILSFTLLFSCSNISNEKTKNTDLTLPKKVALNYGVEKFEKIKTIEFNFNVQKPDKHVVRHWKWNPRTNVVSLFTKNEKIEFVHNNCKSKKEIELDKKFINDSYWLLFPYHLLWDKNNYKYTVSENISSPILNEKSTKLTITYLKGDGYSPNDVYELFLDDNSEIKEWIYRKNGNSTPTKITTWEKTIDMNGVKISTHHNGKTGNFKVWLDQINIEY